MTSVRFVLPGKPRGKQTARVTMRGAFTPAQTRAEMDALRMIARRAMAGRPPFTGAVYLKIACYFPVPKSWPRKRREAALAGEVLPIVKPDGSNIQKLAEDSLIPPRFSGRELSRLSAEVRESMLNVVIHDDSQITDWRGWKRYSDNPRVVVQVAEISPKDMTQNRNNGCLTARNGANVIQA